MKIAYIAFYQGPTLVKMRPTLYNLSLGCKAKVELIAELLRLAGHDIEIISSGDVDRTEFRSRFRFYPSLTETELFDSAIPVSYTSALPIRFLGGRWSANSAIRLMKKRHRLCPFDLVIIQTLKPAQLGCAYYAVRQLGIPVIFQYEDDEFVDVTGRRLKGFRSKYHRHRFRKALRKMSGCMAVSPHLLSHLPSTVPKLLLRGVVNDHIVNMSDGAKPIKRNWVVFSGTHEAAQGLEQLVRAWRLLRPSGWELHIAGRGPLLPTLRELAANDLSIVFHGFLNREENARLLCTAKIGMNPQDVTRIPGTSFAFKIIEYLAAGLHVVTTPRGELEPELGRGVSYIPDNSPETIATSLESIIEAKTYERTAQEAAIAIYGPEAISKGLNRLLKEAKAVTAWSTVSGNS